MANSKKIANNSIKSIAILFSLAFSQQMPTALALPPAEDIPEEVLRTEIVTEGRSPLDGKALSASDYAELEDRLAQRPYPPEIAAKLQNLIFLLQIRKLFTTFTPL